MMSLAELDSRLPSDPDAPWWDESQWPLSPSVTFKHTSAHRFHRATAGLPLSSSRLLLSLQIAGDAVLSTGPGRDQVVHTDEFVVVDESVPHDFRFRGDGASIALRLEPSALGLPPDVLRRAIGRLGLSAIRGLMHDFLVGMLKDVDNLRDPATRVMVADTAIALAKTLLLSAAGIEDADAAELGEGVADGSEPARQVKKYIRAHLFDPTLTPPGIAKACNVSLRSLYNMWSGEEFSLMQWLINERLAAACRQLATTERAVAAIAHDCGFVDVTHFGRRFRAVYGTTPSDWRRGVRANDPASRAAEAHTASGVASAVASAVASVVASGSSPVSR